jgi:23S rRNA pseudouridine1911/1915/1917 synthase
MVQIGRIKLTVRCEKAEEPAIGPVRRAAGLSQNKARKLFATGKVYVDGVLCLDWRLPLAEGSTITVDTNRRAPRRLPTIDGDIVIHTDRSFVVIDKPAGVVSVPPTRTGEPTLLDLLGKLLGPDHEGGALLPLHRLDRETRGLMLFGLSNGEPDQLRHQFERHKVERAYYAVVEGAMESALLRGEIDVSRPQFGGGKQLRFAETEVVAVRGEGARTLMLCRPRTGRYHQLRIQLAAAGHPIVGDAIHGHAAGRRSPMALQSFSLTLLRPEDGQKMSWELPLDSVLESLLQIPKEFP